MISRGLLKKNITIVHKNFCNKATAAVLLETVHKDDLI